MRDTAEYRAEEKNDFTVGDMRGSILRIAVPMIMAQLVNVLYNIVDRVYLGHMEGDGRLALTGVGVAFPLITIINAFANLCGSGGAPLCSIERGRGNLKKAEETMGNSLVLLLLLGVVLTVAGYLFKTPLLYLFGASDQTIAYADGYLQIYLAGNIFVMLGLGMNPFIQSQGFAKTGMLTVVIGALLNLILDPVYTGKTFAGFLELCEKGYFAPGSNVLFLHSGGAPSGGGRYSADGGDGTHPLRTPCAEDRTVYSGGLHFRLFVRAGLHGQCSPVRRSHL